jgi:hypothetical protein
MVDELLTDYPVLSELTQENSTGQIEYLDSLNSSESVQTLLALNALENLVAAIFPIKPNSYGE